MDAFLRFMPVLNRLIFRFRLYIGSFLYPPFFIHGTKRISAQRLDKWTTAKLSRFAVHEADSMRFVSTHTSIPVPRVHGVFLNAGQGTEGWIVMDFIEGVLLRDCWSAMNDHQQRNVKGQIKEYLGQLRSIKNHQNNQICSCTGGPIHDFRIFMGQLVGPYKSITEFHDFLYSHAIRGCPPDIPIKVKRHNDNYRIVFTHADFGPWQIIVRADDLGKIVGILDWETAGWYPEYWEFSKAAISPGLNGADWRGIMADAIGPYYEEEQRECDHIDYQGCT